MDKVMELAKAIRSSSEDKNKTSPYDTTAEVVSVEGGTAWVKIPGGIDRTPATMVVDAKVGDLVRVNISGGKAYVTGNASAPPTDDSYAKKAEAQALRATKAADAASEQAAKAQTSADNAEKNAQRASKAADNAAEDAGTAKSAAEQAQSDADQANTLLGQMQDAAEDAGTTLTQIYADAEEAKETTDEINDYAETAGKTVTQILNDGETAGQAAQEAKASAENASEYAARALGNLSTVQSVTETLNWITAHGTMSLTQDQQLDPTHVYFVVDPNGDYEVGGTSYSVVSIPDVADISTYYELSINESLNNYVGTHLAVTSEGLWLLPDAGGNKVLIATGQGTRYTSAGTYIIKTENATDVVLAAFLSDGAQIGKSAGAHTNIKTNGIQMYSGFVGDVLLANIGYGEGYNDTGGRSVSPFYLLGEALPNTPYYGNYSVTEGFQCKAVAYASHAEGYSTQTTGHKACHAEGHGTHAGDGEGAHAEGYGSEAYGAGAHAEGSSCKAYNGAHAEGTLSEAWGIYSHASGHGALTRTRAQTAIGEYNDPVDENVVSTRGACAFIIGNGTDGENRSNAFTVDWDGDVQLALDTTTASGTDHDLYAAITALGWQNDVIV